MSGRSPQTDRSRSKERHTDDVETYRQRSRQNDRRYREHDANEQQREPQSNNDGNNDGNNDDNNDGDGQGRNRQEKLTLDREQRMARLRQEIKKEDETLAALDKQQAHPGSVGEKQQSELNKLPQESIIEVHQEELEGLDEEEQMRKLLGIDGFGSTKGEAVEDNQSTAARGGAAKNKARKYRQYMNRKSGFNRPLEKMN
jgi:U4/U6.U5 tri-snRNP-associated protein 3